MNYEVAFRRVEHMVGRTFRITGDPMIIRPFIITEVTERTVRCKNEVEEFNLTRIRIASLLMSGQLRDHRQETT